MQHCARFYLLWLLPSWFSVALLVAPAQPITRFPMLRRRRLFALNRMVEVLLYNKARIYDLWAIFLRCAAPTC